MYRVQIGDDNSSFEDEINGWIAHEIENSE